MKKFPGFLIVFWMASGTAAAAEGCGRVTVMSVSIPGKNKIELAIDTEVLGKTPRWEMGAGDPPLPISQAVELSLRWARNRYARFDEVQIREMSLKRAPCSSMLGYWYYVVDFVPQLDGASMLGAGNWLAILMDGTVVEPSSQGEK